jgi:hypothetical protein
MKVKQSLLAVIFISVTFLGCSKKDGFLPDLEGNLVGYVYTFDEFRILLNDHSGVIVTALGLNNEYKVATDKEGRFEFVNLPAGTYEIHFEKTGFGTLKQFGIKHLGGQPTVLGMPFNQGSYGSAFFLIELPTTQIANMQIANDSLFCEFSFMKPEPDYLSMNMYFSSEDNFQIESAMLKMGVSVIKKGTLYSAKLNMSNFPFKSGEKVYFRGLTSPNYESGITLFDGRIIGGISYYFDYENNIMVYPSLGNKSAQYFFIFQE